MRTTYKPIKTALKLGYDAREPDYVDWCIAREKWAKEKYIITTIDPKISFSILVPVYNPPASWLQECIDSVRGQTFTNWQLILADDGSNPDIIALLKKNAAQEPRIKLTLSNQQGGISKATNRAAKLATAPYIFFLDHDDILDSYALSAFALYLTKNPNTNLLYADEDRFDARYVRFYPGFKPQFSKQKLLCSNYIHHPIAIKTTLYHQLGGLNSIYDGSQDYDLLLRVIEQSENIGHIPDVLYHMRIHEQSLSSGSAAKPKAHQRGVEAVKAYFKRQQIKINLIETAFDGLHTIQYLLDKHPKTSILLLIDKNQDIEQTRIQWQQNPADQILICQQSVQPTAKRLNALAKKADGDILIFADGKISPKAHCIDYLSHIAADKKSGLVTGKLIYQGGWLYSAGLVLGLRGSAGRWHYGCNADHMGYGGWMAINHEVSAVPWQLMCLKKSIFNEVGGFNDAFIQNGFDLDLSLKINQLKYDSAIFLADAIAVFPQKYANHDQQAWLQADFLTLWQKWRSILQQTDPFFSPHFSIFNENICIIHEKEQKLRKMGVFKAYDNATITYLQQCFF